MDEHLQKELLETIYRALQNGSSELISVYLPQWDRRNEIAKTLLTISSAAVVLSVTLSSPSVNPRPPKIILWPLMVAWVAFFVSTCLSIATLWVSSRLYGLGPAIVEKRKELGKRIAKAPPKDTSAATDMVDDVISDSIMALEKWDRRAFKTHVGSFWALMVALFFLAAAGVMRFIA